MDDNYNKDMANSKIASFDRTYSTDHIRMLKICSHYIPESFRKNLCVYIKFMELQHALNYPYSRYDQSFKASSKTAETIRAETSSDDTSADTTLSITNLIHELLPFCNPREKQQFQNIENMMNSIEQMKNMMEMMEMMKDMKDMFGGEDGGGFSPDMLAGMMGMDGFDFSNMFEK